MKWVLGYFQKRLSQQFVHQAGVLSSVKVLTLPATAYFQAFQKKHGEIL
jgi:hypothetical protein